MVKKITILRTAVGCLAVMGMINELKKKGVRIIGADCNPDAIGKEFCDKFYTVPRGGDVNFIDEIIKICKKEKVDCVISGPEEEVESFSKNKDKFLKNGILLLVPDYQSFEIVSDKKMIGEFFERNNIPTPKIFNIHNPEFPLILKPRRGRGGKGVIKILDRKQLQNSLKDNKDFILQEFIDGQEYTIDVFCDQNGQPLSIVPRKRLQTESGISMDGITVYDKEIIDYCEKIAKAIKISGPSCIQGIKGKDGMKFIEINARFGGGSILSIKADKGVLDNLLAMIRGRKTKKSLGFKKGLRMRRYYSEIFI